MERRKVYRGLLLLGCLSMVLLILIANSGFTIDIRTLPDIPGFQSSASNSRRHLLSRLDATRSVPVEDQTIHAQERLHFKFELGGYLFNETGRSHGLQKDLTSCLIHSFSPHVEREAAKRFIDPPRDNLYYANSPAIKWFKGELWLVTRIWLDREKYEAKDTWPINQFADNWLYTQRFDRHMRPVSNGSIVGIPSPKQWWVGDGPIEPRLCSVKNRLYLTFNAAMMFQRRQFLDFTVLWDLERNLPMIPKIKGGSPMMNLTRVQKHYVPRDKHWMALIQDDELYFVHSLDPLRILKCSERGVCEFVYQDNNQQGFVFKDIVSHLRGGTPFELYEYPYYLGVAHTTMYKESNNHRFYTAHLVLLCVKPYRIVYVSNDLRIHPTIYDTTPMVRARYIDDGFIFPVGLILENRDVIDLGVHVNDHSSIILRLKGLEALLRRIIELDKQDAPKKNLPMGYLQEHVHEVMEKVTKLKFVHSS